MRTFYLLTSLIALFLLSTLSASAHGAESSVEIDGAEITVVALFDTGEEMSNAQVVVYTPDDPQNSWLTGVADEQGVYTFAIDNELEGRWAVSIRTAGHGEILYLDVAADGTISAETNGNQSRTILAVVVVALLAAVAFYFSRSSSNSKNTPTPVRA